jgi:hypothetical protein
VVRSQWKEITAMILIWSSDIPCYEFHMQICMVRKHPLQTDCIPRLMFHIKIVILHYFIWRQINLLLKPICESNTPSIYHTSTGASRSSPADNIRRQEKTRMLIVTNAGDISRYMSIFHPIVQYILKFNIQDLRFSQRWLWRVSSSGIWHGIISQKMILFKI